MKEAKFQTLFSKWLKYNWSINSVFELKICKNKSLPFNSVKEHQIDALLKTQTKFINYKIPDCGYDQKPFDCFFLTNMNAYVVIMFYKRGQKEFIIIPIKKFIKEKQISNRSSLTEQRAHEIGKCYLLKI
jgi:hypothetical protein